MAPRIVGSIVAVALGMAISAPATAAIITYEAVNVAGNTWRYDYTVTNDGAITGEIELFDIEFDTALYDESSLASVSGAAITSAWDETFLAAGVGVSPYYDVLARSSGIATGESAGLFAVTFTWLGQGTPGAQVFEIYDPDTFELLGSGSTSAVPLPGAMGLMLPGALALAARARRRRRAAEP